VLYKSIYSTTNHLHIKIVNQIANYAFLTAPSNTSLSNKLPEEYFPEIEQHYPGALVKQFIPMDPYLWKLDHFTDFLEARRSLLALKLNEHMKSLIEEQKPSGDVSTIDLINKGESLNVEFKSTFQWDVIQSKVSKDLRFASLKTIAAFLNTGGGTLLLGVEDTGSVMGLETDLRAYDGSLDKYENLLVTCISDHIGAEFTSYTRMVFESIQGKVVCRIDVNRSSQPIYLNTPAGIVFYIRAGCTTRALNMEEAVNYIQINWE
jgi:uncharacterized protein YaaQ